MLSVATHFMGLEAEHSGKKSKDFETDSFPK